MTMRILGGFPLDGPETFQQVQEYVPVIDAIQEFLSGLFYAAEKRDGFSAYRILEEHPVRQQGIIVFPDVIHQLVQVLETPFSFII